MEHIKLNNTIDFDNAISLIESNRPEEEYTFSKRGVSNKNPTQIPYTDYNRDKLEIKADEFVLKLLGLNSITYVSNTSYIEWEKRFEAIASLKKLVAESPISVDLGGGKVVPLQSMIEDWYVSKTTQVSSFMETGDSAFLISIETSEDFWWDADGTNGTVREQAVDAIKPLVVV
tara:strand:- start:3428 stop:3949 length:522 start_codon:yes stop_codon:yes gene_type:complete